MATAIEYPRSHLFGITARRQKPAALRLPDPMHFPEHWDDALVRAMPWSEYAEKSALEAREAAKHTAANLLACPDILEVMADQCHDLGVAGERRIVQLIYLVCTTRVFRQIVSLIVKGASSSGKSFLVKTVLRLFPQDAHFAISGMSDKALIYTQESLKRRILVIYEATGLKSGAQSNYVRTLLTEHHIRYPLPTRTIVKEGPTGLIVTTTEGALHPEMESRCLSVTVDETRAQTARVLQRKTAAVVDQNIDPQWHALQQYVAASPQSVRVPYEAWLSREIKPAAMVLRLRRDFDTVLSLICAHALLHQESRDRDENGTIIATTEDYRVVHGLVNDIISEGAETKVSPIIRETVQAVADLIAGGETSPSLTQLARKLGQHKSTVSRRVDKATELGFLRKLETKRGEQLRIALGDEILEQASVLPDPDVLEDGGKRRRVIIDE